MTQKILNYLEAELRPSKHTKYCIEKDMRT